tara:strand:- start:362 stop:880 length:519 start_codon:yes stop_codon:yes gene_type:complete
MKYAEFNNFNKKELDELDLINNNNKKKCDKMLKNEYNKQINTYKKTFINKKCNNNNNKILNHIINNDNPCNLVYNHRTIPEFTNNNCNNQLFPRITKTNPNIFKGNINQTLENIIISGEETSQKKSTNTEHINQIMPLNMNVENFIFNRDYKNDLSRKTESSRKYNRKKILK